MHGLLDLEGELDDGGAPERVCCRSKSACSQWRWGVIVTDIRCDVRLAKRPGSMSDPHEEMDLHWNVGVYYCPHQTREWL